MAAAGTVLGLNQSAPTSPMDSAIRVHLIDGFALERNGRAVTLSPSLQRLIAYLALHVRPLLRTHVAGVLWLDASEQHAMANLRSTLCRLRQVTGRVVDATASHLFLAPEVAVDLRNAMALIRDITAAPGDTTQFAGIEMLSGDVLPDWYEDWVLIERERFRQLRLRGLEAMCERLTKARRFTEAIECGLAAVAAEPLRESAQRVLIRSYLTEGNVADALRQYGHYRRELGDELGVEPSSELAGLIDGIGSTVASSWFVARSGRRRDDTGARRASPYWDEP